LAALFGEGASTILTGQFAVPGVLQARGVRMNSSLSDVISRSLA
jgi:hypothetical protein